MFQKMDLLRDYWIFIFKDHFGFKRLTLMWNFPPKH